MESGDFKIGGQIIQTVKYADDLVLMAKGETVLQGMIDKVIEMEDAMAWK
jgi:ABC-type cobalamin/Fe3+-siderophores transport system ATPase subunit